MALTYNQTPYPVVLVTLAVPNEPLSKALSSAMRDMGMMVQWPMGDMDDLLNLTHDRLQSGDETLYRWLTERYQAERIWLVQSEGTPQSAVLQITESAPGGIQWREEIKTPSSNRAAAEQALMTTMPRSLLDKINNRWVSDHVAGVVSGGETLSLRLSHAFNLPACAAVIKRLQTLPGVSDLQFQQLSAHETVLKLRYQGQQEVLLTALTDMGTKAERTAEGIVTRIP
ncbi:MAG: DUF2066 domain-containing protein [Magnetococcales bacterium]|nr:DUF2066 domain-containing protein [Magnetococcales bacterium]